MALCGQLEITPDELYNSLLADGEKVIVDPVEHVPAKLFLPQWVLTLRMKITVKVGAESSST